MTKPEPRRSANRLSPLLILVAALAGGSMIVHARSVAPPARSVAASNSKTPRVGARNIEDIRVGDRVLARNPLVAAAQRAARREPDWSDWRRLRLEMPIEGGGGTLKIELLRPRLWLLRHRCEVGGEVELNLPEMGACGTARVLNVGNAPPITDGAGRVVTATFQHPPTTTVLNVWFEDEPVVSDGRPSGKPAASAVAAPLGVTDNHLFWSVDRRDFAPIGEMAIGERVLTYHGDIKRIANKLPRPGPQTVYNLEVDAEHVYFVGEQALLAHNSYLNDALKLMGDDLVQFRRSPLLREAWAIDPSDNVPKFMRTNMKIQGKNIALLDGDHVLPKDPVYRLLDSLGHGRASDSAVFREVNSLINSRGNLRLMPSGLNKSKKDLSVIAWLARRGQVKSVDSRYLLNMAEIQESTALQIRGILNRHGVSGANGALGDFIGQSGAVRKALGL